MFILDSLFIGGLRFVLDKIAVVADAEMDEEAGLRERLLEARMRLDRGEMREKDYDALEVEIFDRLRAVRRRRGEPEGADGTKVVGADVEFAGDDDTRGARGGRR